MTTSGKTSFQHRLIVSIPRFVLREDPQLPLHLPLYWSALKKWNFDKNTERQRMTNISVSMHNAIPVQAAERSETSEENSPVGTALIWLIHCFVMIRHFYSCIALLFTSLLTEPSTFLLKSKKFLWDLEGQDEIFSQCRSKVSQGSNSTCHAIAFWAETPCSQWLFLVVIRLHMERLWPLGSFRRDHGTFFPAIFWIGAGNNHTRYFWYKYKYHSVVSNGMFYSVFHNSLSLFPYNYLSIY